MTKEQVAYLKKDAKNRKKQWDKENNESDGFVVFIIIVAVCILIGNAVLTYIY